MKKVLIIALIVAGATSCKKAYTCNCVAKVNGVTNVSKYTIKDTKPDAEKTCMDYQDSQKPAYQMSGGQYDCSLQ